MTIHDIVGNLRMFVNCNKAISYGKPCYLYMSKDTFDSICYVFQTADNGLYPYDLGRPSDTARGVSIYGCVVVFKEDMPFGAVGIGNDEQARLGNLRYIDVG